MKVVHTKWFPFGDFKCINICGLVFCKGTFGQVDYNHETVHSAQMAELAFLFFYVIYALEWLFRAVFHTRSAYDGVSFEREAEAHEREDGYLSTRRHYAQWRK
ncbi:MAG: hypothetical protein LUC24_02180 [Bacteroidales bacterium]|nr:hypothetical protein [Bacteroidales bacterium]